MAGDGKFTQQTRDVAQVSGKTCSCGSEAAVLFLSVGPAAARKTTGAPPCRCMASEAPSPREYNEAAQRRRTAGGLQLYICEV
jgi:hypothetical protein